MVERPVRGIGRGARIKKSLQLRYVFHHASDSRFPCLHETYSRFAPVRIPFYASLTHTSFTDSYSASPRLLERSIFEVIAMFEEEDDQETTTTADRRIVRRRTLKKG